RARAPHRSAPRRTPSAPWPCPRGNRRHPGTRSRNAAPAPAPPRSCHFRRLPSPRWRAVRLASVRSSRVGMEADVHTGGWKPLIGYAALLAAGAVALQWLDYQRLARLHAGDVYLFLVAAGFLALGVFVGARAFAAPPAPFDGNPKARAELGLSERELEVLHELAAGRA